MAKLYEQLAGWWPLLSPPSEYAEEAQFYTTQLRSAGSPPARTLLELGSGGGNNASHMKKYFRVTLTDLSESMLAVSRLLNPDCEHIQGDMRSIRLGRQFDRVFNHDAISYMADLPSLRAAIETAYIHCRPDGAALFAPDHLRETFRPATDHGGSDADDGRGLRYLEWTWDPDPADSVCTVDYAYLLRDSDGLVTVEHDRHIEGLFSREQWLGLLTDAGFTAVSMPFDHSEVETGSYEIFLALRGSS